VIHALEHRGNFMVDGAYDHQQVRLARRKAWKLRTKTRHIVVRPPDCHELHATASRDKREGEKRIFPPPIDDFVEFRGDDPRPTSRPRPHTASFFRLKVRRTANAPASLAGHLPGFPGAHECRQPAAG